MGDQALVCDSLLDGIEYSILQPMDQSVIKSLKGHYRKKILMEIIESDGNASINMLDAVNFLSKAWEEVTAETIRHSFRHAGL